MKKKLFASLVLASATSLSIAGSAFAFGGVMNGSFETGGFDTSKPDYNTLVAPNGMIDGWTVASGSIDWIGNYWTASQGSRSIDLSGTGPGAISQAFDTTVGNTYTVTFDLSGNPETCSSADKTLTVSATGGTTDPFDFDTSNAGNTRQNMMWTSKTYTFVATDASSTVTFTSTTSGACGPALDNVVVTETVAVIPQPTAKSDCMVDGWQTLFDADGNGFKNQGDCVSYVATGGKNTGSVLPVAAAEKHSRTPHSASVAAHTAASHHDKNAHSKATTHSTKGGHKAGH